MVKLFVLQSFLIPAAAGFAAPPDIGVSSVVTTAQTSAPEAQQPAYVFTPDPGRISPEGWRKKVARLAADYSAAGGKQHGTLEAALVAPYSQDGHSLTGLSPEMVSLLAGKDRAAMPALLTLLDDLRLYDCGRSSFHGDPQSELVYGILGMDYKRTLPSRRRLMREGSAAVKVNIARDTLSRDLKDTQAREILKDAPPPARPPADALSTAINWTQNYWYVGVVLTPPARPMGEKPSRFELKITNSGGDGVKNVVSYMTLPPGSFILARSGETLVHTGSAKWLYDALGPGESRTEWIYLQLPDNYSAAEKQLEAGIGDFTRHPNGTISLVTVSGE